MTELKHFFTDSTYNDFIQNTTIKDEDHICMICSCEYNDLNKVTLECNHIYHNSCIIDLLKSTQYFCCPYCSMHQNKHALKTKCQKCIIYSYADSNLCIYHATFNRCNGILKHGPDKGKQCRYKRKNSTMYCLKHKHFKS